MERFVFVAAVTFAVIFAFVAVVGRGHFNVGDGEFNIEFGDEGRIDDIVAVAPGRLEAAAFAGDELVIKHAAARIIITPEERADFLIEIDNPGRAPMPLVTIAHGNVRIDGQLGGRIDDCREGGGANLDGYGDLALVELPQITIRAPRTLHVSLSGGGATEIGASEALTLDHMGCGTVTAGDVATRLEVDSMGSGTVHAGAAQSLNLEALGSGDFTVGAIGADADLDITGSGSVTLAALTGTLAVDGLGAGDVIVQGGAITTASIDMSGAGDVRIAGPVQNLKVSILGVGDVDVDGVVGDINADISGPGNVNVRSLTGNIRKDVAGAGDVHVGEPRNSP